MYFIRGAQEKDISGIVAIEDLSFPVPWPDFLFRANLDNPGFIVYEEEKKIIGYAILGVFMENAHLLSIAVHPAHRRHRVGSLLLQKCINIAHYHGYESMTLEVREKNVEGQIFYQAHGFKEKEIISGYYLDDNAVRMQCKI
ncbi:ribosomal protein S18-alanine N-acetyltransferase [Methanomethylovorans sp.]|uniref:ribosomal protein S18-alanine N-acetyltransferase n=1 Tax=Methanomethylovorans sp. TaxID=2758717 RepID=UPI00351C9A17